MKICGRCDQSIRDGEKYTTHPVPGATYGGGTVYLHVDPCKQVPTQTSQVSIRH